MAVGVCDGGDGGDVLWVSQVSAGVVRLRVLPVENSSKLGNPVREAREFSSVTKRWSLASGWLRRAADTADSAISACLASISSALAVCSLY